MSNHAAPLGDHSTTLGDRKTTVPNSHSTAMFGIARTSEHTHDLRQETYIISLPKPEQHKDLSDFRPGATITFTLQRYHRNPENTTFEATFAEDITLALNIIRLREKSGRSCSFPYLLDARPEVSLYTNVWQTNLDDPILRMLSNNLRMTFRYSLENGVGYLVHTGYDWPHIDDAALIPLWRTAINLHRRDTPNF